MEEEYDINQEPTTYFELMPKDTQISIEECEINHLDKNPNNIESLAGIRYRYIIEFAKKYKFYEKFDKIYQKYLQSCNRRMKKNYIRLKSYSTVGDSSWIEIFERGYERQVSAEGNTYEEKILSLAQVHYLLNYEDIKKEDHIPAWLGELNSERLTIISLSQRLIELHKALIYLRERYDLKFEISIYLNSVMPV